MVSGAFWAEKGTSGDNKYEVFCETSC